MTNDAARTNPQPPQPAGTGPVWGAQWAEPSMVAAYGARLPYPPQTFDILASLRKGGGPVCEIGAGDGRLTFGLAARVGRIHAIEPSAAMVSAARARRDRGEVRWLVSTFEDADVRGPYSLVVAAESIHWLDWATAFAKIRKILDESAYLAVVSTDELDPGTDRRSQVWESGIRTVIAELSENRDFRPSDVPEALARAGVFEQIGEQMTSGITVTETVDDVVMRLHSMNGLGKRALGPRLTAFDRRVRELLEAVAIEGLIETEFRAVVRWGVPVKPR